MRIKLKIILNILLCILILNITPLFAGAIQSDNIKNIYKNYDEIYDFSDGMAMVRQGSKVGYIDDKGIEVIPCVYDFINNYNGIEGIVGYFKDGIAPIMLNKKCGLIDKKGKIVVSMNYENFGIANVEFYGNNSYKRQVNYVTNNNLTALCKSINNYKYWGFVSKSGKEITEFKYHSVMGFSDGMAMVRIQSKRGFINQNGIEAIPTIYQDAKKFSEGLACVKKDNKWGFIDTNGKTVIDFIYDDATYFKEGFAGVLKNKKWGYIDKKGNTVIPFRYDKYYGNYDNYELGLFNEGMVTVTLDLKYGVMDKNGNEVVACKYSDVGIFNDGMAWVSKDGKYGYIDQSGTEVIPCIYTIAYDFSEGYALVLKNDKWIYIDKIGEPFTTNRYNFKDTFSDGVAVVENNGKFGYINRKGEEFIPCEYTSAYVAVNNMACAKKYNNWYIFDLSNLPHYESDSKILTAIPIQSKVLVDGKSIKFMAYNIENYNYFKLRDIAAALDNTTKNFDIKYDEKKKAISLTSNKTYTFVGGELDMPIEFKAKTPKVTRIKVFVDGKLNTLTAYLINNNNYFKLRDISTLLNFEVNWNEKTDTVEINTKSVPTT